jgi:hypothetical protein
MLPRGASGGDAEVGLGVREMEALRAVREHRGRGLTGVEPARVDLADVGDEVGLGVAGVAQQIGESAEQLVVGDRVQRVRAFHTDNIGRGFASSWRGVAQAPATELAFEGLSAHCVVRGAPVARTGAL